MDSPQKEQKSEGETLPDGFSESAPGRVSGYPHARARAGRGSGWTTRRQNPKATIGLMRLGRDRAGHPAWRGDILAVAVPGVSDVPSREARGWHLAYAGVTFGVAHGCRGHPSPDSKEPSDRQNSEKPTISASFPFLVKQLGRLRAGPRTGACG